MQVSVYVSYIFRVHFWYKKIQQAGKYGEKENKYKL